MASRTLAIGFGLLLSACGPQPQSVAAANDSVEAPAAAPSLAPSPEASLSPSPAPEAQDHTIDRSNDTGAGVVRGILLKVGTLDGERVTGFQLRDRCKTILTTARGTTTIDWSKVEDWAARIEGDQRVIPIDDGNGAHLFGVPTKPQPEPIGDAGALVESGLSGIADNCKS